MSHAAPLGTDARSDEHASGQRQARQRDATRRNERQSYKALVAVIFFGVLALVFAARIATRGIDFDSGMVGVLMSGAFPVASISLLPWVRGERTPQQGPSPAMWVFLLLGVAMWIAAPLIPLANGHAWTDHLFTGDSRRNPPLWLLATLSWGLAAAALFALAAQLYKRAKQRTKQFEEQQ